MQKTPSHVISMSVCRKYCKRTSSTTEIVSNKGKKNTLNFKSPNLRKGCWNNPRGILMISSTPASVCLNKHCWVVKALLSSLTKSSSFHNSTDSPSRTVSLIKPHFTPICASPLFPHKTATLLKIAYIFISCLV